MSKKPLSGRRLDVLTALGENPRASIRELCEMTGIKATSNVWYHLHELEKAGVIIGNQGKARSIYVVDVVKRLKENARQEMSRARRNKMGMVSQKERAQSSKSRLSEAERIEAVVAKAKALEAQGNVPAAVDVVHDFRRSLSVRGERLG